MRSLPLLAPPAHTRQLRCWDLTCSDDLREVRLGLLRFVEADHRDDPDELAHRMGLVATELAGNALRHGRPPVVVRLLRDADCYILDVSDHAPEQAPDLAPPRPEVRAGGRGLHIAHSLAQQLCWYRDERTKHVWASFPVVG